MRSVKRSVRVQGRGVIVEPAPPPLITTGPNLEHEVRHLKYVAHIYQDLAMKSGDLSPVAADALPDHQEVTYR